MEKDEMLLEHLKRLYVTCRSHYVVSRPGQKFYVPKSNGTFFRLTDNVLLKHLHREYAVGIYAGDEGSRFICFDVDDGNPNTVTDVINELEALGIPRNRVYVSFSGRKGYHIEVFFDAIVPTERLHSLYLHVIQNGGFDPGKVEFRPTSKMAIKLPLSIHGETGNICWFVNPSTLEPIMDAMYISEIVQLHVDDISCTLSLPTQDFSDSTENKRRCASGTGDSNTGTMMTIQGTRHDTMVSIAVYQRHKGASREENQSVLEDWYARQPQELINSTPEEVQKDIAHILDWVYSERFAVPRSMKRDMTSIYESQMEVVLEQWSRSSRRIVFLLLARTRMGVLRISASDISKAIGVSSKTVYEVLQKLIASKVITRKEGRRTRLPDKTFTAESSSYIVSHKAGWPNETKLDITMRDLISDFDRTYHKALYVQVNPNTLRQTLLPDEWSEYLAWAQVFESDGDALPTDRRIDILAKPFKLELPLRLADPVTAYQMDGRWLFPAYDMALILGYANPSVIGSQCPHKELWQIQVNRRRLPNGMVSHQVLNKNFIPLQDVFDLIERSSIPEKEAIGKYLKTLTPLDDPSDKQGVIAS